jgi:cyclin-C
MQLYEVSPEVVKLGISTTEVQQLKEYFCRKIFAMVSSLRASRLKVATTACTYFQRFFLRYALNEHDPRILAPACVYLAGEAFRS